MSKEKTQKTRTVRAALETDTQFGAVVPPIHLTSTFAFAGYGQKRAYDYSRSGNPTRDALAGAVADLEGGAGAVVTSSGMAAVALVTQLFRPGQVAVVPHDCYGGTYRLFNALRERKTLDVRFVDFQDQGAFSAALASGPALVWIETPSNPLLRIVDLAAVTAVAHEAGALVVADNTFLSPVWQRPIALGADVVVHSTTKYLNGHSDVVGGAVVAARRELHEQLAWWANCTGVTGAPFDSYLTLRGMRTLHARMRAHGENTALVVALLARHRGGLEGLLPGARVASGPRDRDCPAERVRRDGEFRAEGHGRQRQGAAWLPGVVLARRVPGWRGEPGRAPGQHDPCGDGRRRARTRRHFGDPASVVGRHRGGRRPGGRSRAGAGGGGPHLLKSPDDL